jgi:alpha-L-fucosidase
MQKSLSSLSFVLAAALAMGQGGTETTREKDLRMAWWRDARFGMFIHWGLYSIPAGEWNDREVPGIGEWILNAAQIKVEDYEPLQKQFNPIRYNPKSWVKLAKQAGMKYIVITSKHHDGFSLFDSKLTTWDVMRTPYGRDLLRPLAQACREEGIKLCFYYSIMDWHHPDYIPRRAWDPRTEIQPNFERYITYLKGQLRELLSNYGDIGVVWFDGEWEQSWTHEHGKDLYAYVRSLAPRTIVNNRVDKGRGGMGGMSAKGFMGDFGTPEQEIPATGIPGVDWESCMTMNDTWGYKKSDHNWKSSRTLIRNLIEVASKGGNYLLNVGPTSLGEIPAPSIDRLRDIGAWMKLHGESIYGTTSSPFWRVPWGRVTRKGSTIYAHIYQKPDRGLVTFPGLKSEIVRATWLRTRQPLKLGIMGQQVGVQLPPTFPDSPDAEVIKLELDRPPTVEEVPVVLDSKGTATLVAEDALLTGELKLEHKHPQGNIGFWLKTSDNAEWKVSLPAGKYKLVLDYSCEPGSEGSTIMVRFGSIQVEANVLSTKSWSDFTQLTLPMVETRGTTEKISIVAKSIPKGAVMNLAAVTITRISTR